MQNILQKNMIFPVLIEVSVERGQGVEQYVFNVPP